MAVFYIPNMLGGNIYYCSDSNQAISFVENSPPLICGMDSSYKENLPVTAKKLEMPPSEFEQLVDACHSLSLGLSKTSQILEKYNPNDKRV